MVRFLFLDIFKYLVSYRPTEELERRHLVVIGVPPPLEANPETGAAHTAQCWSCTHNAEERAAQTLPTDALRVTPLLTSGEAGGEMPPRGAVGCVDGRDNFATLELVRLSLLGGKNKVS